MLKSKHALLVLILLSSFTSISFASFDIFDEDSEGYYGSGQTRPFRDAIENTDSLTAADQAFLISVEETRVTDRYYGRVMVGKSKVALNNLTNNSSSFLDTYTLHTGSVNDNLYQLIIDGGHVWQQWVLELEFFFSKQLNYFTDPILVGFSPALINLTTPPGTYPTNAQVKLQQYALLMNIQYIIPRWFSFYPRRLQVHLDAGAGVAMLISNVTGTSDLPLLNPNLTPTPQNTSTRNFPAVGMLGLGARYQLAQHILMGVAYRYYNFGKSKYGPVQGVKWQSNQLRESGIFIDLTYQF